MRFGHLSSVRLMPAGCGLPFAVAPGKSCPSLRMTAVPTVAVNSGRISPPPIGVPIPTVTSGKPIRAYLGKAISQSAKKLGKRHMSNAGIIHYGSGLLGLYGNRWHFLKATSSTALLYSFLFMNITDVTHPK